MSPRREKKMNKTELIAAVAETSNMTQVSAQAFLAAFQEVVGNELARGGEVNITGFGKFAAPMQAARQGRNPATGAAMTIPAGRQVKFKVGKSLKEYVNA